jgi:hypothetical protein
MRTGIVTKVAIASAAVVAAIGIGATAASGSSTTTSSSSDSSTTMAFSATVKPWQTVGIPSLSCPAGSYLQKADYSPGRIVPLGVEVLEPRYGLAPGGAVGVTIGAAKATPELRGGYLYYPLTGTNADGAISSATNWDPAFSHDIVINLHCTTDFAKAAFAYSG